MNGRRAPGLAHPYGSHPWYSTWVIDQGPYRVKEHAGGWVKGEGPAAVVLPPFSGGRIDLPGSTLFSWLEWGAVAMPRVARQGGGGAHKYPPGRAQPEPMEVWGMNVPMIVPEALVDATRTMLFRVNTLWWREGAHRLRADAELALWISQWLLAGSTVDASPRREPLEPDIRVLKENLDQGIGVREWAALLGIHPRKLHRRCESVTGCTPHRLLDRIRLERAESLLLDLGEEIPTIAKQCGFSSREAFSTWFAKRTGQPPGRWRRYFLKLEIDRRSYPPDVSQE
jgi:AraC-like DNA-binding protein